MGRITHTEYVKLMKMCSFIQKCYQVIQQTFSFLHHSNLMIRQEILLLLILFIASFAKHSAASCGSSKCLIRFTASCCFIACRKISQSDINSTRHKGSFPFFFRVEGQKHTESISVF